MDFKPTEEQQLIINAASQTTENILVEADAGCTKTTTLVMSAKAMRPQSAIALAFNKKIAVELEKVMPSWLTVKTFNGLGHQALAKALQGKRLSLVDRKIGKIVSALFAQEKFESAEDEWVEVRDWVDAARRAGIVHSSFYPRFRGLVEDTKENWFELSDKPEPSETLYEFAREALKRSIQQTLNGEIDFDDQIYGSVCLGGVFPQFPLVIVDEAQDLSPLNHQQIKKLGAKARLIVVGDPKQAVYQFRGADSKSMLNLKAMRENWTVLTLHTTFRCPKVVVKRQLHHAPGYTAAPQNLEGLEINWRRLREGEKIEWLGEKHDGWSWDWLKSLREHDSERIAILCRNNAPLLSLAFRFIRQGVAPTMLGREIGKGLIKLAEKISEKTPAMPIAAFSGKVREWQSNETAKAELMDRAHLVAGIEDRAECLLATMENPGVATAGDLEKVLKNLFDREHGDVILATGHKAKGLEFEIVVVLDPARIPSRYALKDKGQFQQEMNLKYVMETRTKRVFVEANLEDFT